MAKMAKLIFAGRTIELDTEASPQTNLTVVWKKLSVILKREAQRLYGDLPEILKPDQATYALDQTSPLLKALAVAISITLVPPSGDRVMHMLDCGRWLHNRCKATVFTTVRRKRRTVRKATSAPRKQASKSAPAEASKGKPLTKKVRSKKVRAKRLVLNKIALKTVKQKKRVKGGDKLKFRTTDSALIAALLSAEADVHNRKAGAAG